MGPRQRRKHQRAKTHSAPLVLVSILGFLLIACIAFGIGMLGNVGRWLQDLPDYTDPNNYLSSAPTSIVDVNDNEIARLYTENRKNITAEECSPYVLEGMVATEDERFYEHGGVDLIGIMRAVMVQLTGGSEGASTITQQLVRNTILSEEQFDKTLERKVREAYIAIQMEKIFSKDEILMMYLNTIYYGHGAYGIEAAAETYFSKSAKDLTLAEAALLVGLPNSPSTYDPTVNPEYALQRRNTVLDRMLKNECITQEEHDAAQAEEIQLNLSEQVANGVYAYPYFVDYVKQQLQEEFSTDVIFKGGLTVKTTIDPAMQQAAESAVTTTIDEFGNPRVDGALVAVDPDTGYIKAMVGGKDYYDKTPLDNDDNDRNDIYVSGQQNITTSKTRGNGSTFKVITLLAALNDGMNPNITINCSSPQEYDFPTGHAKVQNVNNAQYGTISLAQATAVSSNTGYMHVAEAIGNQSIIDMAETLGVDSDFNDVPTLTLGPEGIQPIDMAEVFATIATGGIHRDPVAIVEILNRSGETIYKHEDKPEQVIDKSVACAAIDVLEGVVTGGGSGTRARPNIDQPIIGKTGTTTGPTDLWFCGASPQLAVAVWTGVRNNEIIKTKWGSNAQTSQLPQPIFKKFMESALADAEREEFPEADPPAYKSNSSWSFSKGTDSSDESDSQESPETSDESEGGDSPAAGEPPASTQEPPASTGDPTPPTTEEPPASTGDPTPPTTEEPTPPSE